MELTADQIQSNWEIFLDNINIHITGDRKDKLLEFYKKYEDRLILMPASIKEDQHNAFPGGYVDHINRVVRCSLKQYDLWKEEGADMTTFTIEELVFSAINHDLGKMGDEEHSAYIDQTDQWRKKNLGENYAFNTSLAFASVPDRGLFMLQKHGIPYSFNEMIAIQTHDGLYDPANEKYLKGYRSEQRPRTSLPFILHQGDLMAARIEWEKIWLSKLGGEEKNNLEGGKKNFTLTSKHNVKNKALSKLSNPGLQNMLDKL